ncbi:MAG TPA: inositol monophosphatase family protein [Myxococcaceae bacterium]|nr:inositol monophosphatase family protein [Myxococcaceae bacterium]
MSAAPDTVEALLETAQEGARRAGRVLTDKLGEQRTIEYKGGIDLVTDADKASERVLLELIRSRHPDHGILAEESGASRGTGYRWFVDPLDGTTNYSHRIPHFSVTLAVEGPEGLLAGVVYDPMRDEMYSAARGRGATLNDRPIHPSSCLDLEHALLCTGFPADVRESPAAPVGLFTKLIREAQGVRRFGSAALDMAYVAVGRFDGFWEFRLKPWDIAAGALLVSEAGGTVTRIDGAPFEVAVGDVLACATSLAPVLAPQCAAFVKEVGWTPRRFGG